MAAVCTTTSGRTPRITELSQFYALPGRDHWGAVQSVLFAGGGVKGGHVIGKSDDIGGYPTERPVAPKEIVATIYQAMGIDLEGVSGLAGECAATHPA